MNPLSSNFLNSSDPILGSIVNSSAFSGWWIVFWFLLFATILFFSAKKMADYIEEISIRVNISKAFLGGVILSVVTSGPELIASIFAGINDKPTFALYNELGANSLTGMLISLLLIVVSAYHIIKNKKLPEGKKLSTEDFDHMGKSNKILIWITLSVNLLLMLFICVPQIGQNLYIPGIKMSVVSFVPLAFFIWFVFWSSRLKDPEKATREDVLLKSNFASLSIKRIWTYFSIFSIVLIITAYFNASVVEHFPEVYDMPQSAASGLFLSVSDGLPEMVSLVILMLRGHSVMAMGTVAGSHLYNLSLVSLTDAISTKNNGSFAEITDQIATYREGVAIDSPLYTDAHASFQLMPFIVMACVMSITLNLQTIRKIARTNRYTYTVSAASVGTYFTGFLTTSLAF